MTDEEYAELLKCAAESSDTVQWDGTPSNKISILLKSVALLIYIAGFIAGIIINDDFPYAIWIYWTSAFVSGSFFLGISEIVQLLHEINTRTK